MMTGRSGWLDTNAGLRMARNGRDTRDTSMICREQEMKNSQLERRLSVMEARYNTDHARDEAADERRFWLKSLANRALDGEELHPGSGDLKAALGAAKYIPQGTRLLGDTDLPKEGPTTPEGVIMKDLRSEARRELAAKEGPAMSRLFDPFMEEELSTRVEDLAKSRLQKAMTEVGLA